jgi:hypothetical protein
MFRYGDVVQDLIPDQPSLDGLTVEHLRIDLADFIKTNYSQRPSLEDGVLQLLAGSSNIIKLTPEAISLAQSIRSLLKEPSTDKKRELFFTLHKYIIYLTFQNIQKHLSHHKDKTWKLTVVLDSLNQAVNSYRKQVSSL